MKNCGTKRFNGQFGSMIPGGGGEDFAAQLAALVSPQAPAGSPSGEQDEFAALSQIAAQSPLPQQQQQPRQQPRGRMNFQDLARAATVGGMAGLGGTTGVVMAPILAMLMQAMQNRSQAGGSTTQSGSGDKGSILSRLGKVFGTTPPFWGK